MDKKTSKYLEKLYFDPNHPASYGGIDKVYQTVKKEGKYNISKGQIKKWLSKYKAYTENMPVVQKFKTLKMISPYVNFQWDLDTCSYTFLSKYNSGYKHIAVFVDLLSRYLFTHPLKTLTGKEMKSAMIEIFKQSKPERARSDGGSEYNSIVTRNLKKAALAERNIKLLRRRFALYMSHNNTYNWVDQLQSVTHSINNTGNRNLAGLSPSEAVSTDNVALWKIQHKFKEDKKQISKTKKSKKTPYSKSIFKFDLNDTVKLSRIKSKFHREIDETFTRENFVIADRFQKQGIPLYIVKDSQNRKIDGRFYSQELIKIDSTEKDDAVYKVEKILKTRKYKGKQQKLIQWEGYGKEYNSWINASELKNIE